MKLLTRIFLLLSFVLLSNYISVHATGAYQNHVRLSLKGISGTSCYDTANLPAFSSPEGDYRPSIIEGEYEEDEPVNARKYKQQKSASSVFANHFTNTFCAVIYSYFFSAAQESISSGEIPCRYSPCKRHILIQLFRI